MSQITASEAALPAASLLSATAFATAVRTVEKANPELSDGMADRIVSEAVKFVAAAALNQTPGLELRPSRVVDEGWHALITDTKAYAELCRLLGRFVHHVPETPATKKHDTATVARTLNAIRAAGHVPDAYLWSVEAQSAVVVSADCMHSECTDGGSNCAAPPS
ncbi:glycine-rich domain-containing protein [Streptomyces sp. 5.8]|uniref:glycine-rich domain-containing protein n=1 Tax=Streptomyces sp. 5.8 TaxID=3406571 RepID=UPI003BB7AD70